MTTSIEAKLDAVAHELRQSRRVLFITGAGISADSGLPTYRGVGGLYNGNATEEGMRIEDVLSGEVFQQWPALTWKYLLQIEENCRGAEPNAAHHAIACLEKHLDSVVVLTQNVDGLHRLAGTQELIEIHGNLQDLHCTVCDWEASNLDLGTWAMPPACPACGAVIRPKVVLFGEALPEAGLDQLYDALEAGVDMVFSIGTSSHFPYIVQPVVAALRAGIPTVEINPAQTQLSEHVDYYLPMGAAAAMQEIMRRAGLACAA